MHGDLFRLVPCVVLVVSLGACRAYEPHPLIPDAVVVAVDAERLGEPAGSEKPVTFAQAAQWMRAFGPEVKEVVAGYERALALAGVPTPWPNPTVQAGPEFGFGDAVRVNKWVPFASLGFTIPLSGALAANDDVNRVRAEVARVNGIARHRELFLDLRGRWVRLAVSRAMVAAHDELVRAARQSLEVVRRMVDAGRATAGEVALFELERGRGLAERLDAVASVARVLASVASLVGVSALRFDLLGPDMLFEPPEAIPSLLVLKRELVLHHTGLARIRVRYDEAEALLRLEIARQYPDLRIGPSAAGDAGDRRTTLGLTLGIDLPLFDRNQQGITLAEGNRTEVRRRYEAEASRALAELERAHEAVLLASERHRVLRDDVLPAAQRSIQLARATLAAGSGDALQLLDAERSYRQVTLEELRASLAQRQSWVELELALGRPLVRFPSEDDGTPRGPEPLEEKNVQGSRPTTEDLP